MITCRRGDEEAIQCDKHQRVCDVHEVESTVEKSGTHDYYAYDAPPECGAVHEWKHTDRKGIERPCT